MIMIFCISLRLSERIRYTGITQAGKTYDSGLLTYHYKVTEDPTLPIGNYVHMEENIV